MPLLRHLEVSIVFSVLSQVLHSWILTYITSSSPEFDVSQGEIWLIACLINKEGLRAFFPFQPGLMSLYCGCITHIKVFRKETWSPGKLQGKVWWPLKPSSWAVPAKYTSRRGRALSLLLSPLSLSPQQWKQNRVENCPSTWNLVLFFFNHVNTIYCSRAALYIPAQMGFIYNKFLLTDTGF